MYMGANDREVGQAFAGRKWREQGECEQFFRVFARLSGWAFVEECIRGIIPAKSDLTSCEVDDGLDGCWWVFWSDWR